MYNKIVSIFPNSATSNYISNEYEWKMEPYSFHNGNSTFIFILIKLEGPLHLYSFEGPFPFVFL
jgi:hypothetical protein